MLAAPALRVPAEPCENPAGSGIVNARLLVVFVISKTGGGGEWDFIVVATATSALAGLHLGVRGMSVCGAVEKSLLDPLLGEGQEEEPEEPWHAALG
eukprot:2262265-Prymnesium_polylepis.1